MKHGRYLNLLSRNMTKGSDHMDFLKSAFITACGCLMPIFYFTGHTTLMNLVFFAWCPLIAWDFAKTITPYQQKKED